MIPGRVYDLRDVGFNALAAAATIIAAQSIRWVRRRALRSKLES